MATNDGFGSSEMMYPTVTTAGMPPAQQMVPAGIPFPAPAMQQAPGGPELLTGTFNQTWLMNCLRRRWLMALLLGSLFAALAAGFLLWLFPLSSSIQALVHVQQENSSVMDQEKRFSPQELEVFQETQISIIKSQIVLKSALQPERISQLEAVRKEEPDPITWLQEELKVGFQGNNLAIEFNGEEDSKEMKKIIDEVISVYKKEVLGKDKISSQELREKLTGYHKDLADELQGKIEKYATLAEELEGAESKVATTVLNMLIGEIRQIQQQIMKKKDELVDINVRRKVAEVQLSSTTAREQAVTEALDADPMLANFKADEYTYVSQIRALAASTRSGSSPQIKRLESTLAQLQQESQRYRMETEASVRKELKNAPNDVLAAIVAEFQLRRAAITTDLTQLEETYIAKVSEIKQRGVSNGNLSMLETEIAQLQELESELEYKLRLWGIQDQSSEKELFNILQHAHASPQINEIERYTLAGVGGIAAFCATCYGVALIEFRRRRLNGASDMDEGLGIRVLGVMPSVSSGKSMASGSAVAAQMSESIDSVRATLLHDSTTQKRQVILVTSPATMEGTTTVASHLALSLTRAGRRTLIIDGDIREPALHKLFGMPLDDGLCEVLRTDADVADVIRPTNTEGLWLLTAGHCDMDAIHALATDQLQPIFEKLREEFDFIIIDGAPVLGLADSISIGQHVDGAILTVLRDHSEVRSVYKAIELLKSMGVRLLGSVVNGVPIKADRRITQVHKNNAAKPRKIAATSAKASQATTQVEKPKASIDDVVADQSDGMADLNLDNDVELDFDDLGLDDNKS